MKGFIQDGDTVELTAPYDVAAGAGVKVGSIFGIAVAAALSGQPVQVRRKGVFEGVAKTSANTFSIGAPLYWNDSTKAITTTASTNLQVGAAMAVGANGETTCSILLGQAMRAVES